MELEDSIEALEADLHSLHKALFQYRSWLELQRQAGVDIDRAAAGLLKAVAYGDDQCKRPNGIAQYLGVEAPTITRTAQQLEASGLLSRSTDPKDGRAHNFTVTKEGMAQLKKLQKARRTQFKQVFANWDKDDRDTFIRLLRTFNTDLQNTTTHKEQEKA